MLWAGLVERGESELDVGRQTDLGKSQEKDIEHLKLQTNDNKTPKWKSKRESGIHTPAEQITTKIQSEKHLQ